jgi:tetratricopeptide (TPR) repeat protein
MPACAHTYLDLKQLDSADAEFRKVLDEKPDYQPGWLGLGEICLAQARWPELEDIARHVEQQHDGRLKATLLRGRGMLARKEFDPARKLLSELQTAYPECIEPKVLISHVWLQEGRDWQAAEEALLEVLRADPTHTEARHNLSVLRTERAGSLPRQDMTIMRFIESNGAIHEQTHDDEQTAPGDDDLPISSLRYLFGPATAEWRPLRRRGSLIDQTLSRV